MWSWNWWLGKQVVFRMSHVNVDDWGRKLNGINKTRSLGERPIKPQTSSPIFSSVPENWDVPAEMLVTHPVKRRFSVLLAPNAIPQLGANVGGSPQLASGCLKVVYTHVHLPPVMVLFGKFDDFHRFTFFLGATDPKSSKKKHHWVRVPIVFTAIALLPIFFSVPFSVARQYLLRSDKLKFPWYIMCPVEVTDPGSDPNFGKISLIE
jgi:hypothetical protein